MLGLEQMKWCILGSVWVDICDLILKQNDKYCITQGIVVLV